RHTRVRREAARDAGETPAPASVHKQELPGALKAPDSSYGAGGSRTERSEVAARHTRLRREAARDAGETPAPASVHKRELPGALKAPDSSYGAGGSRTERSAVAARHTRVRREAARDAGETPAPASVHKQELPGALKAPDSSYGAGGSRTERSEVAARHTRVRREAARDAGETPAPASVHKQELP